MNVKAISRNVGYALLVSALFMFFSIVVSVLNGNDSALAALLISFIITFVTGIFPFIFVRKTSAISLSDGYVIIVLSWLLSFIFGMLPYVLWGGPFTVVNAWYESVSGYTTTGSTILENVEALPRSLLFWRSSTHFIGGLGVVVFLLLIIPDASPIRMRLTSMELSSLSREGYKVRANKTVYIFAIVYLGLCALAFFTYWAAGMPAIDAICHAFSVCATGGFSSRNTSIAAFDSRLIEGMTMLYMFVGSIHFGMVYYVFATRSIKPLNNPVLKAYCVSLVCFVVFLSLTLRMEGDVKSFGDALWESMFHCVSVASTTGLAIADNSQWSMLPNMVIVFLGITCGCAGSTSGGVKMDRVLVLLKMIGSYVKKILHPALVDEVKMGKRFLHNDEVTPHLLYICLYFIILLVSITIAQIMGVESQNAFVCSVSSLGNVGIASNDFGNMGNFNSVPEPAKILYTVNMVLGRLEIYPVMAVILMAFSRNKN